MGVESVNPRVIDLKKLLDDISKVNVQDLIREDSLGRELNFRSGENIFNNILKLFKQLNESNLEELPELKLNEIINIARNILTDFKNIKEFSVSQQNPIQQRNQILAQLPNRYSDCFNIIAPIISYSIRKSTDFDALEKNAKEKTVQIDESIKSIENSKKEFMNDIEKTLEKVRQAAAEVGVSQHAIYFKLEAEQYEKRSKDWLTITSVLAVITIIWGIVTFFIHPISDDTSLIIQNSISKLIILSVLYYALVWCGKNYSAYRHNYIINKHRQNALSTFETFVKAAGNDLDTKNAVLLQATQSIFSNQHSGFISKELDSESPNKFIEIIRNVNSEISKVK